MGVAGGALFPTLMALLKDHRSINIAFTIPLAGFTVEFLYAMFGCHWIRYVKDDDNDSLDHENGGVKEIFSDPK